MNLRNSSGDRFVEFADSVLRLRMGLPIIFCSQISSQTCGRTFPTAASTLRSAKGVVDDGFGGATTQRRGNIRRQITATCRKSYARKSTSLTSVSSFAPGYAYRLCVCDEMPPPTVAEWERVLAEEASKINGNAQLPRVLSASGFGDLGDAYPTIVVQFFKPILMDVLHFSACRVKCACRNPQYVPIPGANPGI